jgi:outer membrane protein insertion porin family
MKKYMRYTAVALLGLCSAVCVFFTHAESNDTAPYDNLASTDQLISALSIIGAVTVNQKMILNALPYQVGDVFDFIKTRRAIHSLYALGYFENVRLYGKNNDDGSLTLIVDVTEKKRLKEVVIRGNSALSDRDIFKKIPFATISAIMEPELKQYAHKIKDMYHDKGYHDAIIGTSLEIDEEDANKVTAVFTIDEGQKTVVKRISFVGNTFISDKELRATIITHEDWLLGFLDKSGTYHPGKTEADKFKIEELYQNCGFLNARVVEVKTDVNPETYHMHMTFVIDEGEQYYIGSVSAPGNDILSEEMLLANIPVRPGDIYSREKLTFSVKRLEALWGDQGYIFAHINPSVQLNKETRSIDVGFYSEIGNQIQLRKITVKGNKKTRDKVIRRALTVQEGNAITRRLMESSKNNISALGYFDPNEGVNWKIIKQSADTADLDLVVKEAKTGHAGFQLSWGGKEANIASPATGITMTAEYQEANLFGFGTRVNAALSWAKEDKSAQLHVAHPWLFDKPITGAFDLYHKRPSYNQLRHIQARSIYEMLTGGSLSLGYLTPPWIHVVNNMQIVGSVGVDSIKYQTKPVIEPFTTNNPALQPLYARSNILYESLIAHEFSAGEFLWLLFAAEQDMRNHPVHTSRGHRLKFSGRAALPSFNRSISFFTAELEGHWYTPLIGERDLIFHLHGFFGVAEPISNHAIPYGKLFHIGGDSTVRGFAFGDISPKFNGDSIGAQKAFYINAELIFPINPSMTMKGVLFYDGGSGWDNPYIPKNHADENPLVVNNSFDYRHAVGFGIRILQPMPIRIDWGFKIDPRPGEQAHQVHFGTSFDW